MSSAERGESMGRADRRGDLTPFRRGTAFACMWEAMYGPMPTLTPIEHQIHTDTVQQWIDESPVLRGMKP